MPGPFLSIWGRLLGAVLLIGGAWALGGCDTVPTPDRDQHRPSVTGLQVSPDSLHESDLAPEQVDSLAQVEVDVSARAADPDGTVERVVFVFEPSSNPRGTLSGTLPPANDATRYRGRLGLRLPVVDEIYTVRVFAVDDDSLSSNQVTGQFRFVPTDTSEATGDADALRMQVNGRPDDS